MDWGITVQSSGAPFLRDFGQERVLQMIGNSDTEMA